MKIMIVTGSGGLIGGEVVEHFIKLGWMVHGIDNNNRKRFFGEAGDTAWRVNQLLEKYQGSYFHYDADISMATELEEVFTVVDSQDKISAIVHCAAQPSHDLAAQIMRKDFGTNVVGTFNMLSLAKKYCPEAPFVFTSTNKVYGDNPNKLNYYETETRWSPLDNYDRKIAEFGFDETLSIDNCKHSLFGAGKAAADLYVQEFGRYFNMPTACLRGGCLTGPNHSGVELHGFLNYLIKCNLEGKKYTVFGYKGKQVRDNIHAYDVARFIEEFIAAPKCAEIYNIGGGMSNSISILESFKLIEQITSKPMEYEITDAVRSGDHQWYVSDLHKMRVHYPKWEITKTLKDIFNETVETWHQRTA